MGPSRCCDHLQVTSLPAGVSIVTCSSGHHAQSMRVRLIYEGSNMRRAVGCNRWPQIRARTYN